MKFLAYICAGLVFACAASPASAAVGKYAVTCVLSDVDGATPVFSFLVSNTETHALASDVRGTDREIYSQLRVSQFLITPGALFLKIANAKGAAIVTLNAEVPMVPTSTPASTTLTPAPATAISIGDQTTRSPNVPGNLAALLAKLLRKLDPQQQGVEVPDIVGVTYTGRLDRETAANDGSDGRSVDCSVTR